MTRSETNYWQRLNDRKTSRRTVLRGAGVAGAGGAGWALVGCGGDDDDDNGNGGSATNTPANGGSGPTATPVPQATPTPAGDAIKRGGHFNMAMGGSPRSLDVHFDTFPYNTAIVTNTNNGILQFSPDLTTIETDLATGMPEQPDDLTFTFKINQGVMWQDIAPVNGRELTAEDVKWSIERQMTDEAGKFQHAYFFLGAVDSIDAPDNETVVFNMSKPFAPFLSYVASPWSMIVNREAVEEYGDLTEHAVGTGPFIFKEWQKDVKFELEANPNYWKKDQFGGALPYIDSYTMNIVTDPDTYGTLFIDKQLDVALVGESQLSRVQEARPEAFYRSQPSQFWRQFRMQPTTPDQPYVAPFDDIRVRQAVVQGIDPQEYLDLVYNGDGIVTHGPILPVYENWALKETPEGARFDPAAAIALLEAAGNPTVSGPMIWAATTPTLEQVAQIHQAQLAAIGVTLELQPMELAAYYNQTYAYEYTFSSHTPLNNPDPDENLSSYFGRNSTFFKHHNEDIWAKIDAQATELDFERRQQLVEEVQIDIVNDFPMKFLYTTNNHGFTDPKVQNWFYSADLYNGRIHNIWLDA